ncbi:MAG TPA: hypothetical protein VGF97_14590, partial [Rhizomicrobium sp.]
APPATNPSEHAILLPSDRPDSKLRPLESAALNQNSIQASIILSTPPSEDIVWPTQFFYDEVCCEVLVPHGLGGVGNLADPDNQVTD